MNRMVLVAGFGFSVHAPHSPQLSSKIDIIDVAIRRFLILPGMWMVQTNQTPSGPPHAHSLILSPVSSTIHTP